MFLAIANFLFKYRSYTPIPFVLVMLVFENANPLSLIIGFLVACCGELIRLWGVSWAGSETRTRDVGGTYLIISGPYAYVRNPLYVGNILMYTGLGIMSYALFPYLQIAGFIFFYIQYYFIVKREEEYLMVTFKEDYQDFLKNVNRFFPKFSAFRKKDVVQPPFNLQAGLKSERRSLQAFLIVALLIIIVHVVKALIVING